MTRCRFIVDDNRELTLDLDATKIASRFLDQLRWHIEHSQLDHDEAFYGYRKEPEVQQDLIQAVQYINHALRRPFIELPTAIDWDDRDLYNMLHERFETLNGDWRGSGLMRTLDSTFRKHVRRLNFAVHRLESRPYAQENKLYVSWNKETLSREPLQDQDYEGFTNHLKPGIAYLCYTEVGKNLLDLYHDGLDPSYPAQANQHYYSAEIETYFSPGEHDLFTPGFRTWAERHNIDLSNKRLGIGRIPIGRMHGSDHGITSQSKITNIIIEGN